MQGAIVIQEGHQETLTTQSDPGNNLLNPNPLFNPNTSLMNQEYQMQHSSMDPSQSHHQSRMINPSSSAQNQLHPQQYQPQPPITQSQNFDSNSIHYANQIASSSSIPPAFTQGADVGMIDSNGFPIQPQDNSWSASNQFNDTPDQSDNSKRGTKRSKDEMADGKSTKGKAKGKGKAKAEDAEQSASAASTKAADGKKKNMGLPPAKRACLFCRNRKSRCDGNQPCGTCVKRGKESECEFTVSRRGGRPKDKQAPKKAASSNPSKAKSAKGKSKRTTPESPSSKIEEQPKEEEEMEEQDEDGGEYGGEHGEEDWNPELHNHLSQLFQLSELPQNVRVPGAVPQLAEFQSEDPPGMDDLQDFNFDFSWPMMDLDQGDRMQGLQGENGTTMDMRAGFQNPHQQAMEGIANLSPSGNPSLDPNAISQIVPQEQGFASTSDQQVHSSSSPSNWINQVNENPSSDAAFYPQPPQSFQPQVPQPSSEFSSAAGTPLPAISQMETPVLPSQPIAPPPPAPTSAPERGFATATASTSTSNSQPMLATSRASRLALLAEFYKSLYRFIPVTLPASVPNHLQILERRLPPTEESPFLLSLQALLPLLRERNNPGQKSQENNSSADGHSQARKRLLRAQAAFYERKATDALESILERADNESGDTEMGSTNSSLGGEKRNGVEGDAIEVIQALCVLTIYHYGSGRALKARLKADQALGLAMAHGLHRLSQPQPFSPGAQHAKRASPSSPKSSFVSVNGGSNNRPRTASETSSMSFREDPRSLNRRSNSDELGSETFEMKKRCWWTVWTLVLWSAYNTGRIPTVRADDPRVSCDMPIQGNGDTEVWYNQTRSLQTLLLVQERVLALSHLQSEGTSSPISAPEPQNEAPVDGSISSLPPNAGKKEILGSMLQIDTSLQTQIAEIEEKEEQDHSRSNVNSDSDRSDSQLEDELVSYLKTSAAIQIYTASLTLHIGQAFKGATLFERKLCFLNSVSANGNNEGTGCSDPLPMPEADSFFNSDAEAYPPPSDTCGTDPHDVAWLEAGKNSHQDIFARGPFFPRVSLQRCVHASKKLLAIARQKRDVGSHQPGLAPLSNPAGFPSSSAEAGGPEPNPFNACSYVLISFTLLMQALAIAGRGSSEEETEENFSDEDENVEAGEASERKGEGDDISQGEQMEASNGSSLSRDLLDSARQAAVLSNDSSMDTTEASNRVPISNASSSGGGSNRASHQRMARLEQLWNSVAEARGVLEQTAMTWDMALPMFEEVNLCLKTSQLLLNQ